MVASILMSELDAYRELEWRGLIHQSTDPELADKLNSERFVVYCGFDPTASSLTVGHLMQLTRLRRFQLSGHRPIALAGGGTGMIGDPTGKEAERPMLSPDLIASNVENFRTQMSSFLDFSDGPAQALLLENSAWLKPLGLIDFLRDVGKHFSVNAMVSKDSVRRRLEEREQGISFTEFSYQLLQAYDFLYLFDNYGCRLQTSGSDQWGNITAGIELIHKTRGEQAYGLTSPLITRSDGKVMSKTGGSAVWLDPQMTSPYRFFQYWYNTDDADVVTFLRYFTFLSKDEIEELAQQTEQAPAKRQAQLKLAQEVTALVHGMSAAEAARAASAALFATEIGELDEATLLDVLADAPSLDVSATKLANDGFELVDLLVDCGLATSRGDARTQILGGGVYVNNVREASAERKVASSDLMHGKYLVVRRGKKTYSLVRFH